MKYYIFSGTIRFVVDAKNPMEAIVKLLRRNPNPESFGEGIVVSTKGFNIKKHIEGEPDKVYNTVKLLTGLGYYK